MTREVARREIESLDYYLQNHTDDYSEESHTAMMMAISALSDYDKMQEISLDLAFENDELINKSRWIPVSERLPEKNIACLVAVGKLNITQMAMYSDLMGTISHRIFYQGDVGYDSFVDITEYVNAWQPLPKPYKKGGE